MSAPALSVVVPCYNEAKNLPELVERLLRVFDRKDLAGEVVLVDDGSADDTGGVIRKLSADHPRVATRFDWLAAYLERKGVQVDTVEVKGTDVMARLLSGAAIGDWVSYYLALAHGHDPSALPGVESLKRTLSG